MRGIAKRIGKTAQEIKDGWAENSARASKLGTFMHLSIEAFLNGAVLHTWMPELGMLMKFIKTLDGLCLSSVGGRHRISAVNEHAVSMLDSLRQWEAAEQGSVSSVRPAAGWKGSLRRIS
jgi:hypothetical protein